MHSHKIVHHLFGNSESTCTLPVSFVSLLLFQLIWDSPASVHFQGNPTKCTWKFFFWFCGTKNNTCCASFRNFQIPPPKKKMRDGKSITRNKDSHMFHQRHFQQISDISQCCWISGFHLLGLWAKETLLFEVPRLRDGRFITIKLGSHT